MEAKKLPEHAVLSRASRILLFGSSLLVIGGLALFTHLALGKEAWPFLRLYSPKIFETAYLGTIFFLLYGAAMSMINYRSMPDFLRVALGVIYAIAGMALLAEAFLFRVSI